MEERIVESNIRRTFTVRFPNLYCVWQRCRDIRGSYRNVLLLIVLYPPSTPEGSWRGAQRGRERRVAAHRTKTENRERETVGEDERQKTVISGGEREKGGEREWKGGIYSASRKAEKEGKERR